MARNPKRIYFQTGMNLRKLEILRKELKVINMPLSRFVNMLVDNYFFKKYGLNVEAPETTDWEEVRKKYGIDNMLLVQDIASKLKPNKIELAKNVVIPKDFKK